LGLAYKAQDRKSEASKALTQAQELYQQQGNKTAVQQVEAVLAQLK
jgi:hypothetical protein